MFLIILKKNKMKNKKIIALQLLSCCMLQARAAITTPSPDYSSMIELKSATKGFSPPHLTNNQCNTILYPASGLVAYNSNENLMNSYKEFGCQNSSGGTAIVIAYANTNISKGILNVGTALIEETQTITATVTTVGTYSITASANGVTYTGSGIFKATGAQDIVLTATGTPIAAATSNFVLNTIPNCSFNRIILVASVVSGGVNAICNGSAPTEVVPIISTTGKTWMDRNLGASRAATSFNDYQAYGCLYQWGRGNDDHASITWSSTTEGTTINIAINKLSIRDSPGNALFIANFKTPYDWRTAKNDGLWQGVNGINNPCPTGYRLPTTAELTAEVVAYAITNAASAYASPLKFVVAGIRGGSDGFRYSTGTSGSYWSSTVSGTNASSRNFSSVSTNIGASYRSNGFSVRCIKN
jgi:uncharacterized protein (TIGR02145 family)